MKKIIIKYTAVILSAALLLSGCGAELEGILEEVMSLETESVEDETQTETRADVLKAIRDMAENTLDESDTDGEVEEFAVDQIPEISITPESREWYTDDGATKLLEAEASRVEVTNDGFDALKAVLEAQWDGLDMDNCNSALEMAKEQQKIDSYFGAYSLENSVSVQRIDSNVVSLCESWFEYWGGPHGTYGVNGRTFDVKSGRELRIEDILGNPDAFYGKAIDYILAELDREYGTETLLEFFFPEYEETVRTQTFWGEYPVASWYLGDEGIVIDYNIYTLAPYAAGAQSVTLPYGEFDEYLKEEYRK